MRLLGLIRTWTACALLSVTATLSTQASSSQPFPRIVAPALTIVLRPETDGARKVVGIEIEQRIVTARPSRPLTLTAPLRFAGMVPVGSAVADLSVSDANGRVDTLVQDVTMPDGGPGKRWTSRRPLTGTVSVRYRLPLSPLAQGGPPFGIKAAGLGVGGNSGSLLVLPDLPGLRRSTLRWDLSRMVPGSRGVIAGGTDAVVVDGAPEALIDRWLMAGPLTDGQARHGADFNAYTLGSPPFNPKGMVAWSRRVYASLADAFGYLGRPRYLLLIRTLDAPSYVTGTASVANGASLINVGSPTYLPGQSEEKVKGTIAHEMTHNWVGDFGDRQAGWFTEGLTVYVSATLPCEAGLRPWTACASEIGRWARAYYGSEARDWSMDRIEASPFAREDVRRVPYGRGMMYFANLDATIRASSNGRRTLLTALHPLFEKRKAGQPLTMERWETWLRREGGTGAVALFRRTVLDGGPIAPAAGAFGPRLRAVPTKWMAGSNPVDGYEWQVVASGGARG